MAATKKNPARSTNNAAVAHAASTHVDPVSMCRAELQDAGDAVKHASRALVLAQRRHEDARIALQRATEDRELSERI